MADIDAGILIEAPSWSQSMPLELKFDRELLLYALMKFFGSGDGREYVIIVLDVLLHAVYEACPKTSIIDSAIYTSSTFQIIRLPIASSLWLTPYVVNVLSGRRPYRAHYIFSTIPSSYPEFLTLNTSGSSSKGQLR